MSSRLFKVSFQVALALAAIGSVAASQSDQASTNVITGTVEKVDSGAKTIAVKTADGTIETVKFTEKTTVHGLKNATKGGDLAGKEGSHVIVHTVGEGADKTAHSLEWVGDKTVHATEGTVEDVGEGSKTVAVKTADKADPELPGETGFVALDAHPMHQRHEVRNALGRQLFSS